MERLDNSIKKLGQLKEYQKDEMLFHALDEATAMYYVLSGEIRIYKMDDQGKEVEVVRINPGDFLGEAIVFISGVFPFYAQAAKDSKVLLFEKNAINKKIEKDPSVAKFFLNLLARKCMTLNTRIEALGLQTIRQRLIQYLFSHCSGEKQCLIELKLKKVELAKMLGTISETLSRNLKQMQDQGLIEVRGKKIYVKDCSRLRAELFY